MFPGVACLCVLTVLLGLFALAVGVIVSYPEELRLESRVTVVWYMLASCAGPSCVWGDVWGF